MDHPYRKKVINIILTIIVLIAISIGGYSYYKFKREIGQSNLKRETSPEIKNLINKVSKLYLLPEGEIPTIATVTDPESLKKQSFFSLAEKGDKVLIFTKAGRAVLYRPAINKIIEVKIIEISANNNSAVRSNNQNVTAPIEQTKTN